MSERYRPNKGVEEYERQEMVTKPVSELKGKAILSMREGERVGQVEDVLSDPSNLRVSGVVLSKGGLFDKERRILPAADIKTWGKDALLVENMNVFRSEADLPERDTWVSATSRLNGLAIVSSAGDRLGQVSDVLIDKDGKIVSYLVSEGTFGGRSREIPAGATRSIGRDAVIVELDS
jgi:uncharacterized protein YrrD